jgi:hypothetical protein
LEIIPGKLGELYIHKKFSGGRDEREGGSSIQKAARDVQ